MSFNSALPAGTIRERFCSFPAAGVGVKCWLCLPLLVKPARFVSCVDFKFSLSSFSTAQTNFLLKWSHK